MALRALTLLLVLPLLAGCARCGRSEKVAEGVRPVAVVNGEPIGVEALRRELALDRPGTEVKAEPPTAELRRRVLDGAVDRLLLLQQARARQLVAGPEQVERALLRLRAEYPGTHFDDLLAQEKLSAAELQARLRDQLTLERLLAEEVFPRITVSDEELRRWYDEHAAEFDTPEQVRVRQVVVRTREEAVRVRDELRRKPQAFAEVARRASMGPEARNGGDLGFFGKGSGMPEVFDACFTLPLQKVSDVTPSPYGFHVFQVTERRPAARRPFAEAAPALKERLLRERRTRAQEEYVAALRQKAQITVDQKLLDALAP
ncbi:MAG: peptidyl-prolyl cis-trans isomerase [Deltaproteobacteria bacterium]|nr:peptidyl-prolyl cis-trans isomerase [Deltaproteobacteria bacterium]